MGIILNHQEEMQQIKKETSNELCTHAENEVNKLCSNNNIDTLLSVFILLVVYH